MTIRRTIKKFFCLNHTLDEWENECSHTLIGFGICCPLSSLGLRESQETVSGIPIVEVLHSPFFYHSDLWLYVCVINEPLRNRCRVTQTNIMSTLSHRNNYTEERIVERRSLRADTHIVDCHKFFFSFCCCSFSLSRWYPRGNSKGVSTFSRGFWK